MIGQKQLLEQLEKDYSVESAPLLSLIVGDEGGGKSLIAKHIAAITNRMVIQSDERSPKVDEVRNLILQAYTIHSPSLFIILDIDKMSKEAANSLLKVIEEPPNDVLFVLTASEPLNVLSTIRSRARVYQMCPYTEDELAEYALFNDIRISDRVEDLVLSICNNPGELTAFIGAFSDATVDDFGEFYDWVDLVVDNIAKASTANAFKIAMRLNLNLNTTEDKFNLMFFWRLFAKICFDRGVIAMRYDNDVDQCLRYMQGVSETYVALRELKNHALNRQMIFDDWLLRIREQWN